VVHPLLEGGLSLLQCLLVLGQVGGGLADHALPALEGLPLPVEPVLEGGKLLLLEAQSLFAVASLFLPCGKPSLSQAQALYSGVSALLTSVEQGFPLLSLL
jgi:hypothetical protein